MWYQLKPYALVLGGAFVLANSDAWLGLGAGMFAVVMGLWVFRMRGAF